MAKKGTCVGCERPDVTLAAKDCCSSCYKLLSTECKGDVEELKKYRKIHKVHPHTEAKAAPAGKRTGKKKTLGAPVNPGSAEEIVQKKRVVLDLDVELRISSFKITLAE